MLIETINTVCGEGRWMNTRQFEPTPAWTHALEKPACVSHLLLLVEDVDSVVGWCRTFPESCQDSKPVVSLGIGLLPAYRNQGIGTSFIRRSLVWAIEVGLRRVTLTTHPANARAIHVFSKCGFSFSGQICNGSIEMRCDLSMVSEVNRRSISRMPDDIPTHKGAKHL
jgi:GNAT superfamily N-acetyltransferase